MFHLHKRATILIIAAAMMQTIQCAQPPKSIFHLSIVGAETTTVQKLLEKFPPSNHLKQLATSKKDEPCVCVNLVWTDAKGTSENYNDNYLNGCPFYPVSLLQKKNGEIFWLSLYGSHILTKASPTFEQDLKKALESKSSEQKS